MTGIHLANLHDDLKLVFVLAAEANCDSDRSDQKPVSLDILPVPAVHHYHQHHHHQHSTRIIYFTIISAGNDEFFWYLTFQN